MVPSDVGQTRNTSNIRVIARVRPPVASEKSGCTVCPLDNTLEVVSQDGSSLQFILDKVHGLPNGDSNTQADVFSDIQDIVLRPLEGLNGCVMIYGQTGSGKAYTMAGDVSDSTEQGLISRSIKHLAQGITGTTDGSEFEVYSCVAELSQESAKELVRGLHILADSTADTSLAVQQSKALGFLMTELMQMSAKGKLVDLTQQGHSDALARQTAAFTMKAATRCSHVIINLTVHRHLPGGGDTCGKLTLVKLAGSEEQDKILALGLCLALKGIAEGKASMALIICCSPAASDAEKTLSSLHFGAHARSIMTSMQASADGKHADIVKSRKVPTVETPAEVKEAIETMRASVEQFTQMLGELEEETSVQAPAVSAAAGAHLAQLTAVLDSLMELQTENTTVSEETMDLAMTATERLEEAAGTCEKDRRLLEKVKEEQEEMKAREEIACMLDGADAAARPQANACAARPQEPQWTTMQGIASNQLWWLGVCLVISGVMSQGK
ncbi:g10980 [Coccomyxa viridis]|uniref:G10980 protein n=1 Tax=Coccomyxa viridis TaxID=1274662 RepID=A0ABP1GCM0_9CHLO